MVGGFGFILANHHLCGGYFLESCGYADRQVCEMVGREMYGRKEVVHEELWVHISELGSWILDGRKLAA